MIKNFYLLDAKGVSIYENERKSLSSLENCYFDIYRISYNEKEVLNLLDTITSELGCNTATSMKRNGFFTNVQDMKKLKAAKNKRIILYQRKQVYDVEHQFNGKTKTCTMPAIYKFYWDEDPLIVTLYQCIIENDIINLQALYTYLAKHKKKPENMTAYLQNYISYFEISSEPLKRQIYDEEYRKMVEASHSEGAFISVADYYRQREREYYRLRRLLNQLDHNFDNCLDIAYKNTKTLEKVKKRK